MHTDLKQEEQSTLFYISMYSTAQVARTTCRYFLRVECECTFAHRSPFALSPFLWSARSAPAPAPAPEAGAGAGDCDCEALAPGERESQCFGVDAMAVAGTLVCVWN